MTITNKTDALIFDMDGTLWDAIDSYTAIWNMAFERTGSSSRVTRDELLSLMGTPIDDIINRLAGKESVPSLLKTISELEISELPALGGNLYPGVQKGMTELSRYYKLFLLSNCDEQELPIFVRYARLEPYITGTLSYGDTQLPKAKNIRLLMQQYSLQSPVYIGDTEADGIESHKAEIPFVWVSYGFGQTTSYDLKFNSFMSLTDYFISLKTT